MKHEISPDKQTVESCLKQKSYYETSAKPSFTEKFPFSCV